MVYSIFMTSLTVTVQTSREVQNTPALPLQCSSLRPSMDLDYTKTCSTGQGQHSYGCMWPCLPLKWRAALFFVRAHLCFCSSWMHSNNKGFKLGLQLQTWIPGIALNGSQWAFFCQKTAIIPFHCSSECFLSHCGLHQADGGEEGSTYWRSSASLREHRSRRPWNLRWPRCNGCTAEPPPPPGEEQSIGIRWCVGAVHLQLRNLTLRFIGHCSKA